MPSSNVAAIQKTLQKTNEWLVQIMRSLHYPEPDQAYAALRVTLHALRDRLGPEEATHFGAQLPMLVRGIYYEGWKPRIVPLGVCDHRDFLTRIEQELDQPNVGAEAVVRSVFRLLAGQITPGEIALPERLREYWSH